MPRTRKPRPEGGEPATAAPVAPSAADDVKKPGRPPKPEVERPEDAQPLIKGDTREKLLYKIACSGLPLGNEFFDNFDDEKEIARLSIKIGIRRLALMVSHRDYANDPSFLGAMRLLANLTLGVRIDDTEAERPTISRPSLTMPVGASDGIQSALDKIKDLSGVKNAGRSS
jgi:hypothetical protein